MHITFAHLKGILLYIYFGYGANCENGYNNLSGCSYGCGKNTSDGGGILSDVKCGDGHCFEYGNGYGGGYGNGDGFFDNYGGGEFRNHDFLCKEK